MSYFRSTLSVSNVIEIAIIAFIFYEILIWIRGTQAEQVVKGLIILVVLIPLSRWLKFTTLYFLLNSVFTWAFIIFVVVFQPELRSALEQLGNNRIFNRFMHRSDRGKVMHTITQVSKAVMDMSDQRIGALIVCERNTGLKDIMATGVILNADISTELIENIFTPNRPLHDGGMIVDLKSGKIRAAGCLLPLTDNRSLSTELGTRHRSAIGISEKCDAFTIVVSEETGTVSYTERGRIVRGLDKDELELLLSERFAVDDDENEDEKENESEAPDQPEVIQDDIEEAPEESQEKPDNLEENWNDAEEAQEEPEAFRDEELEDQDAEDEE